MMKVPIDKATPLFDSVALIGVNDNSYSREFGTKIFLLEGARTDIDKIIFKKIEEYKKGQ